MRTWKDEDGVGFRASFEPIFDDSAAGGALDAKPLFGAIANGDPLILIGNDHPVVLLGLAYAEDRPERAVAGFVLDPKPMVGRRPLDHDELIPELGRRRAAACGAHEAREGVAHGIRARIAFGSQRSRPLLIQRNATFRERGETVRACFEPD